MTKEQAINLVEESIQKGLSNQSNIEPWIKNLKAWSTSEVKCMLNNLGKHIKTYLEVGVFHGATFFSTVSNNNDLEAYAVDIFVEDLGSNPGTSFKDGLNRLNRPNIKFLNKDCFTINKEDLPNSIDMYFYDGPHDFLSQEKALTYYFEFMSDTFILIVDDFNGPDIEKGTRSGLELLKDKYVVDKEWVFKTSGNMSPIWWNGMYIAVISKR